MEEKQWRMASVGIGEKWKEKEKQTSHPPSPPQMGTFNPFFTFFPLSIRGIDMIRTCTFKESPLDDTLDSLIQTD